MKTYFLSLYSKSEEARLRRLLRGQVSTDGKPSHVFGLIKSHAGPNCFGAVLKSIFLEHMPDQMKALLAVVDKPHLLELTAYAGLLVDALNLTCNQACAVANADSLNIAASLRNSSFPRDSFSSRHLDADFVRGLVEKMY